MVSSLLAACASDGREQIRFTFSKREAIEFMTGVVNEYNSSQDKVEVVIDTSGVDVVSASFVRGNPPDVMLTNFNFETARFIDRCAVSDLSDLPEADRIKDELWPLIDQYGVCPGQISALPYSVMSASVIYNKEMFEEYNLEVPQTWDELIAVSDTLLDNGVTPFYGTFKDDWTVGQGWYDYSVGGSLDVLVFFNDLALQGEDVGPDSPVSFQNDFLEPSEKMQYLADNYVNADAASRGYGDGNLAFAQGKAAMYLQGPWAFSEIAKTAPDLELGTFPMPMTDDPADLKVRVNMDLAAFIPAAGTHQEAARDFLQFLFQPEKIAEYNASQLGFTPTTEAAPPDDPRIEGMIEYYNNGQFYQGPSVLVPKTIPVFNYTQAMVLGDDAASTLAIMDADWARLAFRQPAPTVQTEESSS